MEEGIRGESKLVKNKQSNFRCEVIRMMSSQEHNEIKFSLKNIINILT